MSLTRSGRTVTGLSAAGVLALTFTGAPAHADDHWTLTVEPSPVRAGGTIDVLGDCPGVPEVDEVSVYAGTGFEGGLLGDVPISDAGVVSGSVTIPEGSPAGSGQIEVPCPDGETVLVGPLTIQAATTPFADVNDWDGDGNPDVVAADAQGRLFLYPGDGTGTWLPTRQIGHGWAPLDQIQLVGDWDGDGDSDILARVRSTGDLLLYRGDGSGGFAGSQQIGVRWGIFETIVAPGDWDGDGAVDILGKRATDGALFLYRGDGSGGFLGSEQVGRGWLSRDLITPVGDWDGDGDNDLVARDWSNGDLWLYEGDGLGGFTRFHAIGRGWGPFDALVGPGDWNGDTHNDLLGRDSAGDLYLYRGDGAGGFVWPFPQIGNGWSPLRMGS